MVDFLITLGWFILFQYFIIRWKLFRLGGLPGWFPPLLFSLKFLAGCTLVWIYTHYYPNRGEADIFKFFDDSRIMHDSLENYPGDFFNMVTGLDQNAPYYDKYYVHMKNWLPVYDSGQDILRDTRFMIRLNAFLRIFSLGIYHVHVLFWCFFSFIGLSLFYKSFYRFFRQFPLWLAATLFLIPSVLCWGSGVLKEGVVLLFLGLFLYPFFQWVMFGFRWKYFLSILTALIGFSLLKMYVLLCIIPACFAFIIIRIMKYRRIVLINSLIMALFFITFLNVQYIFPSINPLKSLSERQQEMIRVAYYTGSRSVAEVNPLIPTLPGLIRNLPEALLNATLRPSIFDAENLMQWLAAFENLILFFVIILLPGLYRPIDDPLKKAFMLFCLSYTFILFAITGLSTPVLGALVRYRMPALPFLVIALLLMMDMPRLRSFVREFLGFKYQIN